VFVPCKPFSQKPVPGVTLRLLSTSIEDSDTSLLTSKAISDRDGFATLHLLYPRF